MTSTEPGNTAAIIERVEAIIAEHVRPYIEMDGGTIDFVRLDGDTVFVRLAGACTTCPSSAVTLKGGVERNIRRRVPEVRCVELESDEPVELNNPLAPVMIQF
ncbi:MAG TPA: NifU family protein [Candidatus Kapabacteria bacterium]|nr:NifU family protein [Candidatus Kapabacteria bacterium]